MTSGGKVKVNKQKFGNFSGDGTGRICKRKFQENVQKVEQYQNYIIFHLK